MDKLDQFIQDSLPQYEASLGAIEHLLDEVWDGLVTSYDKIIGWPYEIPAKTPATTEVSASTVSMIAFSLGLAGDGISPADNFSRLSIQNSKKNADLCRICGLARELISAQIVKKCSSPEGDGLNSLTFGKNDPFSLAWIVPIFFRANALSGANDKGIKETQKLVAKLLDELYKRLKVALKGGPTLDFSNVNDGSRAIVHAFPELRAVHSFIGLPIKQMNSPQLRPCASVLGKFEALKERLADHFVKRVYEQLAYHEIENSQFDAAELIFSFEGALLCDPDKHSLERQLAQRVFEVMRERQKHSLYWRPLRPIVSTAKGHVLLPLSIEIANSMLRVCDLLDRDHNDQYFAGHLDVFSKYTEWIQTRVIRIPKPEDASKFITGWHSEHDDARRCVQPWDTAQTAIYLLHYRKKLRDFIAHQCIQGGNFHLRRPSREKMNMVSPSPIDGEPSDYWRTEWESIAEPIGSDEFGLGNYKVLSRIRTLYIEPRDSQFKTAPSNTKHYSMLLYGPPGTGKTTIAMHIAGALRRPLIVVTPSDFIKRGESAVEACAKSIFLALMQQENSVILFDEIDRMILDRATIHYERQADMFQFMTPSMLIKLNELRQNRKSIFIVATNYEERIDPAAKRVGRIDNQFFVSPPDLLRRKEILSRRLEYHLCKRFRVEDAKAYFSRDFIAARLEGAARATCFANFGELDALVEQASLSVTLPANLNSKTAEEMTINVVSGIDKEVREGIQQQVQIRLGNYVGRFLDKERKQLGQSLPMEEFRMLLYLASEVKELPNGQSVLTPTDKEQWRSIITKLGKSNETAPEDVSKEFSEGMKRLCGNNLQLIARLSKLF